VSGLDFDRLKKSLDRTEPVVVQGRIVKASGLVLEASLPRVALGTACEIRDDQGHTVQAEVVGFNGPTALLVPFGEMDGIREGSIVIPRAAAGELNVGDSLLGRVVDARMAPLDGGPAVVLDTSRARATRSSPWERVLWRVASTVTSVLGPRTATALGIPKTLRRCKDGNSGSRPAPPSAAIQRDRFVASILNSAVG
jgi:flagellar biosynthesis/type III secretory pathway ATPase